MGDPVLTLRAQVFREVAGWTLGLVLLIVPIIMVIQPDTVPRGLRVIVVIGSLSLVTLSLNHLRQVNLACWLFLGGVIALLTTNAPPAGGIRSPGIQAFFIFVMLAGLLLGQRAGMLTALVCALLGLGLVVLERTGHIAPTTLYGPEALWLLTCVYTGVALLTMRIATKSMREALQQAAGEVEERRRAQSRLSQALEAGNIGVFDHDLRTNTFSGDDRAVALTGLQPDPDGTLPYAAWRERVHPDDLPAVEGVIQAYLTGASRGSADYRIRPGDGAERHLEVATYLNVDASGKPEKVVGMLVDITDRRQAERERERLVRDLGERVKELRLLHDASILLRSRDTFDPSILSELVRRVPAAWCYPDDCMARITYLGTEHTSSLWQETPWRLASEFRTSEGPGLVEVAYRSIHPAADDGPFLNEERELIASLAVLLRSHIEEHATEEQRRTLESRLREAQKMEALGTLAGGIAHDFNNILTAIGGNAELALGELEDTAPAAASLRDIVTAHARARDLVRRILLFSRQEATVRHAMSPGPVVEEALQLLRASLPPTIQIQLRIEEDLPPVFADATQWHQVVMNLGTNAVFAMRERGGTLTVRLELVTAAELAPAGASTDHVRLTVQDTGAGMSRDVRERLFEPFFTTKGSEGTGLGLSVVHGIIREHGGSIRVESEPGQGTAILVDLPAAPADGHEPEAILPEIIRGQNQHVMAIDDDSMLANLMVRALTWLGYRCTPFTDPAKAIEAFLARPGDFDAVLTDLQMPGLSGLEVARAIRAVGRDVPIALVSGSTDDTRAEAIRAGVSEWIAKPSTIEALSVALHGMMVVRHPPTT
jgi:PAS domain S-box-containing protein